MSRGCSGLLGTAKPVSCRGSRDEKHVVVRFFFFSTLFFFYICMKQHAVAAPGVYRNHRGWEVMSKMADNVAVIIFFSLHPPTSWRETGDAPGAVFSDCLLLDVLYLKMFSAPLQTPHSIPSVHSLPPVRFFFSQSSSSPLPLYPPQVLFVPDIKHL